MPSSLLPSTPLGELDALRTQPEEPVTITPTAA
jgi:hypothetical protein